MQPAPICLVCNTVSSVFRLIDVSSEHKAALHFGNCCLNNFLADVVISAEEEIVWAIIHDSSVGLEAANQDLVMGSVQANTFKGGVVQFQGLFHIGGCHGNDVGIRIGQALDLNSIVDTLGFGLGLPGLCDLAVFDRRLHREVPGNSGIAGNQLMGQAAVRTDAGNGVSIDIRLEYRGIAPVGRVIGDGDNLILILGSVILLLASVNESRGQSVPRIFSGCNASAVDAGTGRDLVDFLPVCGRVGHQHGVVHTGGLGLAAPLLAVPLHDPGQGLGAVQVVSPRTRHIAADKRIHRDGHDVLPVLPGFILEAFGKRTSDRAVLARGVVLSLCTLHVHALHRHVSQRRPHLVIGDRSRVRLLFSAALDHDGGPGVKHGSIAIHLPLRAVPGPGPAGFGIGHGIFVGFAASFVRTIEVLHNLRPVESECVVIFAVLAGIFVQTSALQTTFQLSEITEGVALLVA